MPKPSIGRTVHCHLGNAQPVQRDQPYPATITRVNQDGTVDLHVLGDSQLQKERTQTNVVLPSVKQGEAEGEGQRWWWPPLAGTEPCPTGGQTVSEIGVDGVPVGAGAVIDGDSDAA